MSKVSGIMISKQSRLKQAGYIKFVVVFLLLAVLLFAGGLMYGKHWLSEFSQTRQTLITEQLFSVVKGDNSRKVIRRLTKLGLIEQPLAYRLLLLEQPALGQLKVGRYRLTDGMTPVQLFELLSSGVEAQFSITLLEGATFSQWLETFYQNDHVVIDEAQRYDRFYSENVLFDKNYPYGKLEGMFFPDTYHFSDKSSIESILIRSNAKLKAVLAEQWKKRQKNLPIKTPYQALILASIIEKETAIASERKNIASVFVNRLRKGMRLQTDPTVIYGVWEEYAGDITRAHLKDLNPYNTYKIKGLPPTPIAMVSEEAIIAALNPNDTPYLYFVAAGDGGHYFSKTLSEHNKALRRYLSLTK